MSTVIKVENLSKHYRLGLIGGKTLHDDLNRWWARVRKQPDPLLKIGQEDRQNGNGEYIWALRDINFEVQQGEIVGIIGRNGAGKSTLLKILSRITAPTSGQVKVKGRIASLLEVGTGFHPELTGRENIYLNGAILGMKKAEIDRKFDEIVAFAEVEKFIDTPVKRYSSGMYVRLAFAVAAHLEPEILVVDEVLAVGDGAFQKKCLGKMGEVAKEGRTVLFVSHNMAAIQGLCSKCLLFNSGQLASEGASQDIVEQYLTNGLFDTPTLLEKRKDRQGSGEIRFLEVSIRSAKGQAIDLAVSGQDIDIVVSYSSREDRPIRRLDIHITFYTTLGQFMFNCSSAGSAHSFEVVPSRAQMVCHIPELPLAPGRYVFNLYSTIGGAIADWIQQAGYLNVIEGDYFGTGQLRTHKEGFLVKNRWSVKTLDDLSQGSGDC